MVGEGGNRSAGVDHGAGVGEGVGVVIGCVDNWVDDNDRLAKDQDGEDNEGLMGAAWTSMLTKVLPWMPSSPWIASKNRAV